MKFALHPGIQGTVDSVVQWLESVFYVVSV